MVPLFRRGFPGLVSKGIRNWAIPSRPDLSSARDGLGEQALHEARRFYHYLSRNGEKERASLARRALEPYAAAVRLDNAFGDRQPESRSALVRGAARLPVSIEDAGLIGEWNARPAIRHRKHDATRKRASPHRDAPAVGRELERVP